MTDIKKKVDEISKESDIHNENDLIGFKQNITRNKQEKKATKITRKKKEKKKKSTKKELKTKKHRKENDIRNRYKLELMPTTSPSAINFQQTLIEKNPNKKQKIEASTKEFTLDTLDEIVKREVYGICEDMKIEE